MDYVQRAVKAYRVEDRDCEENYSTVIFAETAQKARVYALHHSDCCMDSMFINIRAKRVPDLDTEYRGHQEMDWDDPQDRLAMAKAGWCCLEPPDREGCEKCAAYEVCSYAEVFFLPYGNRIS